MSFSDLYRMGRPLLFRIEPEAAHGLTIKAMKAGLMPAFRSAPDPALRVALWDRIFPNPVGLAAGFDKNAEVIGPALRMGFGFVEAGTVTPRPQAGNPSPRVFRAPEQEAVINRMGFPGAGAAAFKANLERFLQRKPRPAGVVGLNIGMNKDQTEPLKDYRILLRTLGPLGDYIAVNVSSPNTPGLRDLQKREPLLELLGGLTEERKKSCGTHAPPLLLKLAPDLDESQQEELASTVLEAGIDGLILTNTTLSRPESLPPSFAAEKGGLSGRPLKDLSTAIIRNFYRLTEGKIPIIGVGGVSTGDDAYEKILAGASLVQLYTGLVYEGPGVATAICARLSERLRKDGYKNILEAIGRG